MVALLGVLVLAALLRVASFNGYGYRGGDDGVYADLAHSVVVGQFGAAHAQGAPIYPGRIGTIAPAALFFRLFGPSERSLAVYPFIVSLAGIVLAFIAGRMIFGNGVGLIAALLVALLPADVRYATLLYPDPVAILFVNIAILLVWRGVNSPNTSEKAIHGVLAGLALGLSWLCKESVLFSIPLIAGYLLWQIRLDRRDLVILLALALGGCLVVVVEGVVYYHYLSDFFYHFHAIERHNRDPLAVPWFWKADASWSALLARLFRDGPETILLSTQFGLVTSVAVLAVAYGFFKRAESLTFVGGWFAYEVLVLNFGSHSLHSYMPLPAWDRYFWSLLLPAVLLTSALLYSLTQPRTGSDGRFWAGALLCVMAVAMAHGIYRNLKEPNPREAEHVVARILPPSSQLFTDQIAVESLRFLWHYPEVFNSRDFSGLEEDDIPTGAYVLVKPYNAEILRQLGWRPPRFFEHQPQYWTVRWEDATARLYHVPGRPDGRIERSR